MKNSAEINLINFSFFFIMLCATYSSLVLRQKSSRVNCIYLKFFLIKKSIFNKKNTLYKHKGI